MAGLRRRRNLQAGESAKTRSCRRESRHRWSMIQAARAAVSRQRRWECEILVQARAVVLKAGNRYVGDHRLPVSRMYDDLRNVPRL